MGATHKAAPAKKIMNFEDFLKEKHGEDYIGTDDDMPDAFDHWSSELEGEQYIRYADEYGQMMFNKGKN